MRKSTHTPEYTALRAQLYKARADAGLSLRDLAARLRVPHSWIAKVESGERRIDLIEYCWVMAACGADAENLLVKLARTVISGRDAASGKASREK